MAVGATAARGLHFARIGEQLALEELQSGVGGLAVNRGEDFVGEVELRRGGHGGQRRIESTPEDQEKPSVTLEKRKEKGDGNVKAREKVYLALLTSWMSFKR